MLKLITDIMDAITSKDGPKLSTDVLSHSAISHEFHCEKAWQNIIPTLKLWLTELSGLQVSYIVYSKQGVKCPYISYIFTFPYVFLFN